MAGRKEKDSTSIIRHMDIIHYYAMTDWLETWLKAELRDGTLHCSNGADKFMESIFQEYLERGIKTYLRGDSGFSSPKLYETCESNGCSYAIRLKQNLALIALASDK